MLSRTGRKKKYPLASCVRTKTSLYLDMMKQWLKPLLVYRKFFLAERILKQCCTNYAWVSSEPHEAKAISEIEYPNVYLAANFMDKNISKPVDSKRLLEAVDLLEINKHITCKRHPNLYRFSIKCTKEGERAFNDGFYKKLVLKFWIKMIGLPSGLFGILKLLRLV